jgi:hypothetical protein
MLLRTAAVLLLYSCFTAALLLLYCCNTAAVLLQDQHCIPIVDLRTLF